MIESHRAAEITFYEELGVAPGASPEEIRDAFRSLVRLLHPDQHTDVQLKEIAEHQMRKLNRIYAVLSDPERRRRYDQDLDADPSGLEAGRASNPARARVLVRSAWVAAILAGVGLLLWLTPDNTPAVSQSSAREQTGEPPPAAAPLSQPVSPAADQASRIAQLKSDLQAVTLERDAAIGELGRLRGALPAPQSAPSGAPLRSEVRPTAVAMTELPPASRLPALPNSTSLRIERPVNRQLAGFWFYAKPPKGQHNRNRALYPPEFIEATVSQQDGVISGKYRARYEIVDRAISPDVNFSFKTTQTGPQIVCPWTGPGGARGEITLKLVSENSLRIDWTASELGTQQGLDAGTAVLTRRIE